MIAPAVLVVSYCRRCWARVTQITFLPYVFNHRPSKSSSESGSEHPKKLLRTPCDTMWTHQTGPLLGPRP